MALSVGNSEPQFRCFRTDNPGSDPRKGWKNVVSNTTGPAGLKAVRRRQHGKREWEQSPEVLLIWRGRSWCLGRPKGANIYREVPERRELCEESTCWRPSVGFPGVCSILICPSTGSNSTRLGKESLESTKWRGQGGNYLYSLKQKGKPWCVRDWVGSPHYGAKLITD